MGAMVAAGITAAAGVFGDMMSSQGQSGANAMNMAIAQDQMAFQQQSQQTAMNYNTQMSDTAEQRRVSDLRAAGLNPMMAVTAGAASAPTMSGQQGASQTMQNPNAAFGQLGSQAQGAVSAYNQTAQQMAQTANTAADTQLKQAEVPYAASQAQATLDKTLAEKDNLYSDTDLLDKKWDYQVADTERLMNNIEYQKELFPLQQRAQVLSNQAQSLGMPRLEAESRFWQGPLAGAAAGLGAFGGAGTAASAAKSLLGAGGALNFAP